MGENGEYSKNSFDFLFEGYDEVKDIEIEKVQDTEPKEESSSQSESFEEAAKRRRGVRRNVETPIQSSNITWNFEYDDTKYRVMRIVKRVAIALAVLLVLFLGIFVVYPRAKRFIHEEEKMKTDITSDLTLSEDALAKKFDLDFSNTYKYDHKIPIFTEKYVNEKPCNGISIITIAGEQVGICIDSSDYEVYGLKTDEGGEYSINSLRYNFTNTYKADKDLPAGVREVNYYYSTKTNDCFAVLIDADDYKIKELAYFYNYKDVLGEAL